VSGTDTTQETLRILREFWTEVLDLDSVRPADRVLDLGGDSLVATMIANRIELTWGFRPSMEEMLSLSLDELSALCVRRRGDMP
jgi:acyl carrier protein